MADALEQLAMLTNTSLGNLVNAKEVIVISISDDLTNICEIICVNTELSNTKLCLSIA